MIVLEFIVIIALFAIGVWLSAFFSGAETSYYRLSVLRVNVEAQTGNRSAKRMLWFVRHPAEFVATVLIGNNLANYVTTLSVGLGLALLTTSRSDAAEILMTLAAAPIVFLFGELIPKHVNYLTPMASLGKRIRLFRIVFWLVRPLSLPLVWLTRFFEAFSSNTSKSSAAFLGRPLVRDLLDHGRVEGVFTERQAALTNRLLRMGARPVAESARATSFSFGLAETATREQTLEHAHAFGLSHVPMHRDGEPTTWTGSVRVADLFADGAVPIDCLRPLARVEPSATRLAAIQAIRDTGGGFGLVVTGEDVVGYISLQALVRPLFQAAPAIAIAESQAVSLP